MSPRLPAIFGAPPLHALAARAVNVLAAQAGGFGAILVRELVDGCPSECARSHSGRGRGRWLPQRRCREAQVHVTHGASRSEGHQQGSELADVELHGQARAQDSSAAAQGPIHVPEAVDKSGTPIVVHQGRLGCPKLSAESNEGWIAMNVICSAGVVRLSCERRVARGASD